MPKTRLIKSVFDRWFRRSNCTWARSFAFTVRTQTNILFLHKILRTNLNENTFKGSGACVVNVVAARPLLRRHFKKSQLIVHEGKRNVCVEDREKFNKLQKGRKK